jgi:phenylacetate-coenzyme A ligase PaaK-like adenylate-forming protein
VPNNIELNNSSFPLIENAEAFKDIALSVFQYQYAQNGLYRSFADALHIKPEQVKELTQIPFLPISFFKTHEVTTGFKPEEAELVFMSSGTTATDTPSRHYVRDAALYENALLHGFRQYYGAPDEHAIIALLPSYLERGNASLVYMAQVLMRESGHVANGFYLDEWDKLHSTLQALEATGQKTLLIGVTFALLDFAEAHPMQLNHTIVMETGGMKGRKKEMTRAEVHSFLKQQWGLPHIHSEYGMTELLSQAYALRDGIFQPTATMQVLVRDINDPLEITTEGSGCLNIIDLANLHSCAFIATDDLGNISQDGSFTVLGRMDHSALRGCSLMTA